ncbi:uncharacterized protein LOC118824142 isoform X2 [Colossoma macropomum]|uniref:uncharacterized protein LOC118824142 isoform X2 n=1 Tax=Colossoma macropomum TaxID=42526 RepID=UPI001863E0ED|nr:uncharacterized protein LOC118824142 isoform X2 [Colossoma macropomum]
MVCCVVYGCSNNSNNNQNGVSFHGFPAVRRREGTEAEELSQRRRNLWIERINRENFQPSRYSKVCSRHFVTGKPAYGMLESHPDWAPSLHLGHEEIKESETEGPACQLKRKQPRKTVKKTTAETDTTQTAPGDPGDTQAAEGKPAYGMLESHPDWAPSLHLGHDEIKTTETEGPVSQLKRKRLRKTVKKTTAETDTTQTAPGDTGDTQAAEGNPTYGKSESQTDWTSLLHLGHGEVKATKTKRPAHQTRRKNPRKTPKKKKKTAEKDTTQIAQGDTGDTWAAEGGTDISEPAVKLETECDPCAEISPVLIKTEADCDFCECMRAEVNRLLEENRELRRELDERKMSEEFLKADDVKVMYYTGLTSFAVLMDVLNHIRPFLPQMNKMLSPFQMLFLTLMRLRLDLPIQLIADLFHTDLKTVSTTFVDTMDVLYAQLGPLIDWPERQCLLATMPPKFIDSFGDRAAIILDCFEVEIEGPSSPKARAQSFSHNRHNRTVKYLIGFTPAGAISFVSKGFGGCCSDKHVAENSGLLDKLSPGDLVLADHGFDIEDSVGMMCAEVKDPAFTKGQRQLDVKDVEETRQIAHLRVRLERVMGSIRDKYAVLNKAVPNSLVRPCEGEEVTLLDKIISVCCALANVFPSVVVKCDDGHDE